MYKLIVTLSFFIFVSSFVLFSQDEVVEVSEISTLFRSGIDHSGWYFAPEIKFFPTSDTTPLSVGGRFA